MGDVNPFRDTFLRWYWAEMERAAAERFGGLYHPKLVDLSERDFFKNLYLDLKVKDSGDRRHDLEEYIHPRARIVLFDQVGAGKRTAARNLFYSKLYPGPGRPDYLPCWLPHSKAGVRASAGLRSLIWRAAISGTAHGRKPNFAFLKSWLNNGPPLLLFLEWDLLSDIDDLHGKLQSFLDDHPNACCVVTCHSNLGAREDDWKDFQRLTLERAGPHWDDEYRRKLAGLIGPGGETKAERILRGRLPGEGVLPQLVHLFRVCPDGGTAGDGGGAAFYEAQILDRVVHHLLAQMHDSRVRTGALRDLSDYRRSMQTILGRIALTIFQRLRWDHEEGPRRNYEEFNLHRDVIENLVSQGVEELSRGGVPVPADELRDEVVRRSSFFVVYESANRLTPVVRFIDPLFLAYFAGAYGLTSFANAPPDRPDADSSCRVLVDNLAAWPQSSPLAASFLGSTLSEEDLNRLLLCALTRRGDFGDPENRDEAGRLVQGVLALCQGAKPAYPVPKALREGEHDHGWRCLEDPSLFRSELHALLIDRGRDCDRFRERLEQTLRAQEQPWLERRWPELPASQLTTDHRERVTALIAPRGRQVISGDAAGDVIWWDLTTGKRERLHTSGSVRALAAFDHKDVRYVVSAGDDGVVHLWRPRAGEGPRSGEVRRQPQAHAGEVLAVAVLSPDGPSRVLSAGGEGLVYVWSPFDESGEPVASYPAHRGGVRLLHPLRGTSPRVASAGDDGCVCVWCFKDTGEVERRRLGPPRSPSPVTALADDGDRLVWGDELGRTFSAPVEGEASLVSRRHHTQPITDLRIKGGYVYSAAEDGRVARWIPDEVDAKYLTEPAGPVRGLAVVKEWVVYATEEGTACYEDRTNPVRVHPGALRFLKEIPDDEGRIVTAGGRLVRVGTLAGGIEDGKRHFGPVTSVAVGKDFIVSGGGGGSVMLHEGPTGSTARTLRHHWPTHHSGPVRFLRACGRLIVTAGADGKVCVWERGDEGPDLLEVWEDAPVTALWADENDVVWATEDGYLFRGRPRGPEVRQWRLGSEVTALDARRRGPGADPDVLVALSRGRALRIDTAPDGRGRPLPTRCRQDVLALRWLDARRFVLATAERAEVHHLVEEGDPGVRPCPIDGKLSALGCGPDGGWLACGTVGGGMHAVNWQTGGKPLFVQVHGADGSAAHEVVAVRFASSDLVVSASRDGTIKLCHLTPGCVKVLGGCPAGAQVTSLAVWEGEVLAGLVDGSVLTLWVHSPGRTPSAR